MTSTANRNLVVYGKYPIAGEVKTRLVPPLSHRQAADLYGAFVHDLLHRLDTLTLDSFTFSISDLRYLSETVSLFARWGLLIDQKSLNVTVQSDGDLGRRFDHTFSNAVGAAENGTIILGSDHPTVPLTYLEEGFRALSSNDVVVGPAEDGGFYAIGQRSPHPGLYDDLPWSHGRLFQTLVARCRQFGLSVHVLPTWYDVDRGEDLVRLVQEVKESENYPMIHSQLESVCGALANQSGVGSDPSALEGE